VETGTVWGAPARRGACYFIFASYTARHLVGISVGIGSNLRRKSIYIQIVMALVGYRPGHQPSLAKRAQGCPAEAFGEGGPCAASFGWPATFGFQISNSHDFAISQRIFARVCSEHPTL